MKISLILLILLAGNASASFSNENYDLHDRIIGFSVYRSESGSGYGQSINMNISIENNRKHLEFGVIYQNEMQKFSGGEILYKRYFNSAFRQEEETDYHRNVRYFMQYNFIFRYSNSPDRISENIFTPGMMIPGGQVATFEHYLGAGILYRLVRNFYLSTGLGYGITLGSLDEKFWDVPHYSVFPQNSCSPGPAFLQNSFS